MMRTGIFLNYAGGFLEAVDQVVELEKVGVDIALVAEAYSYDAISQLGFLAAKTSTIELGTGVVPIYIRTPTLLAMTAAGLDYVSDGRFRLGIGTSGPQVMEGFHGVPFDAPLGRTREVVDICRQVWRRERVQLRRQVLPDSAARRPGHRPRQAAAADQSPCPRTIPITIAALGPKNVELTAEIAEGWQPVFFYPEKADDVWGESLRAGFAKRDPALGPLDVMVSAPLAIGDDVDDRLAWAKPQLALYIGGMGARGKNFYHNLATRYGYGEVADHIQDLYLAGKKAEAIEAVPDELVRAVSLVGPRGLRQGTSCRLRRGRRHHAAAATAVRRPQRNGALRRGIARAAAVADYGESPAVPVDWSSAASSVLPFAASRSSYRAPRDSSRAGQDDHTQTFGALTLSVQIPGGSTVPTFADLGLPAAVVAVLAGNGIETPFPDPVRDAARFTGAAATYSAAAAPDPARLMRSCCRW